MTSSQKVAVVTGGSRGIGFEICHQLGLMGYHVVFTSRTAALGEKALSDLHHFGIHADYFTADAGNEADCKVFADWLATITSRVDLLVNNAGVFLDTQDHAPLLECGTDRLLDTFSTNLFGAVYMTRLLVPLLEKSSDGQIINVSSMLGQLDTMHSGFPAYRLSKLALNGTTKIFAEELASHNIRINSICPGWCRTELGSQEAPKSAAEGASEIVWLATDKSKVTGKFFNNRSVVDW